MATNPFRILCVGIICGGLLASAVASAGEYFNDSDRVSLRNYIPAPTNRGILYHSGSTLPATVNYTELPSAVTVNLPAPPPSGTYVSAGGNLYLIDRKTRMILDSIEVY